MNINFVLLNELHFPLLLIWLEKPHVKAWWDSNVQWTPELIYKKYSTYVKGYKIEEGAAKKIGAYIIHMDEKHIGYIQIYNAYDFARSVPLEGLPEKLIAFDIFIGEENYLNSEIGTKAIKEFFNNLQGWDYTHIFADPDPNNIGAVKAYEKAGFKKIKEIPESEEIWMIKEKENR